MNANSQNDDQTNRILDGLDAGLSTTDLEDLTDIGIEFSTVAIETTTEVAGAIIGEVVGGLLSGL